MNDFENKIANDVVKGKIPVRYIDDDNKKARIVMMMPFLLPTELQKKHDNQMEFDYYLEKGIKCKFLSWKLFVSLYKDSNVSYKNPLNEYLFAIKNNLYTSDIIVVDFSKTLLYYIEKEKLDVVFLYPSPFMNKWYMSMTKRYRYFSSRESEKNFQEVSKDMSDYIEKYKSQCNNSIYKIHMEDDLNDTLIQMILIDL